MKLRQIAAAAVCAAAAANSFILPAAAEQEADPMNIVIDGNNANTLENMLYRGVGIGQRKQLLRGYCWTTRLRIPRRTGRS